MATASHIPIDYSEDLSPDPSLCRFGAISDIQYADVDNGSNYRRTRTRYYRNALLLLDEAVETWNTAGDVQFVLQLGDIIDGYNKRHKISESSLQATLDSFSKLKKPVYHVWGNHEFYNFTRAHLMTTQLYSAIDEDVSTPNPNQTAYYHFSPVKGFRVVVLDVYEVSMLGYSNEDKEYQEAERTLKSMNRNKDLNSGNGLGKGKRHFVQFNGALGEEQLGWLQHVLEESTKKNEKILVAGHTPLDGRCGDVMCILWNYEELLAILHAFPCVVAYFSGHTHRYGYVLDEHKLHHVTFPGVVEAEPGSNAFATVDLHQDRMEITGVGTMPSVTLMFDRKNE